MSDLNKFNDIYNDCMHQLHHQDWSQLNQDRGTLTHPISLYSLFWSNKTSSLSSIVVSPVLGPRKQIEQIESFMLYNFKVFRQANISWKYSNEWICITILCSKITKLLLSLSKYWVWSDWCHRGNECCNLCDSWPQWPHQWSCVTLLLPCLAVSLISMHWDFQENI